jgi:hypothetical protein
LKATATGDSNEASLPRAPGSAVELGVSHFSFGSSERFSKKNFAAPRASARVTLSRAGKSQAWPPTTWVKLPSFQASSIAKRKSWSHFGSQGRATQQVTRSSRPPPIIIAVQSSPPLNSNETSLNRPLSSRRIAVSICFQVAFGVVLSGDAPRVSSRSYSVAGVARQRAFTSPS